MLAGMNKSQRLDELVEGVEDLLARLPDSLQPEIVALRDKVDAGIMEAWTAISRERAATLRERAERREFLSRAAGRSGIVVGLALLAAASLFANRMAQSRATQS